MSGESKALPAELVDILKEIPEGSGEFDPESPELILRGLRDGSAVLRKGAAGLSAVERELLNVHREELAYRLALVGQRGLLHSSPLSWALQRKMGRDVVDALEVHDEGRLDETIAGRLVESATVNEASMPGERLISVLGAAKPSFEEVLWALSTCVRLLPRSRYRIWWAVALLHSGRHAAARESLQTIRRNIHGSSVDAYCLFNLGFIRWQAGKLDAAADDYSEAYASNPELLSACVHALWLSVMSDREDQAQALAGSLRERSKELDQSDFDSAVSLLRSREQHVPTRVQASSMRLASRLSEFDPKGSARVLEPFRRP